MKASTLTPFAAFYFILFLALLAACSPLNETEPGIIFTDDGTTTSLGNVNDEELDDEENVDPDLDPDNDGLTNAEELECGSDINLFDTDADNLSDHAECVNHGTDPTKPDSDDDGWDDFNELFVHSPPTDPLDADDDGDGVGSCSEETFDETTCDCDDNDPGRFPGNPGDVVNGVDIDCVMDVKEDLVKLPKGYTVEVEVSDDYERIDILAHHTDPITSNPAFQENFGCAGDPLDLHHANEDKGECHENRFFELDVGDTYECASWGTLNFAVGAKDFNACPNVEYVFAPDKGFQIVRETATSYSVNVRGFRGIPCGTCNNSAQKILYLGE